LNYSLRSIMLYSKSHRKMVQFLWVIKIKNIERMVEFLNGTILGSGLQPLSSIMFSIMQGSMFTFILRKMLLNTKRIFSAIAYIKQKC